MTHSVSDLTVDITQTYDGDRQVLKRYEVDTIYEDGGSSHTETNTLYQLRSSALGGKVVTEVGAQGQKARTYVYADGALLAWQTVMYVNGGVMAQLAVWEHREPSNASYRTSQSSYADPETWAELDSFGSNAGLENPYQTNPPPQNHKPNIFYPSFSLGSDGTCRVDQVQESCSRAMQLVNAHAASVKNGRPGFYGDYLIIDHAGWDGKTLYQNSRFVGITIRSDPQNTYDPRVDFRDYAEGLSKNKSISDCQKLALMIYKAGQVFGGSNPFSDSGSGTIHGLMAGLTEYTRVASGGREGPSNPNYRVGVFTHDTHYGGSFGDSGFSAGFQDGSNQVRHFTFYLGAGWGIGSTLANQGLYREERTNNPQVADVGLGLAATDLGSRFNGNYKQLAQDVWHRVCGQSSNLNLP
jgi:hypothetical protein